MKYIKNEVKIKELFNKIAINYDNNNNIISFGLHNFIKKNAIKRLKIESKIEL